MVPSDRVKHLVADVVERPTACKRCIGISNSILPGSM